MKFALSTNWCNRRLEDGKAIAEKALALGFDELELGFHTTLAQVAGFKAMLDQIPVGSVHAFCPVPLSAPQGYPELYQLANPDEDGRRIARFHVVKNIEFAAEMGAATVVLHAGRVPSDGFGHCFGWDKRGAVERRTKRGAKFVEILKAELGILQPVLEQHRVTLALENLPYLEGFPNESELKAVTGEWVRGWFDTGHDYVRQQHGWKTAELPEELLVGMHIQDSCGDDDHLPPGEGKIDFAALKGLAMKVRHLVLEPSHTVKADELRKGLDFIRKTWS